MIKAMILGRGFDRQDVLDIFHHTKQSPVSLGIRTYLAQIFIGDVVALFAFFDILFEVINALNEIGDLLCILFEQVQNKFKCSFPADPR